MYKRQTLYWLVHPPLELATNAHVLGWLSETRAFANAHIKCQTDAPVADPNNVKLARQSIFLHRQRDHYTFSDPITRNGATKLCGDGPIDQSAAETALAGRGFNRGPPLSVHTRTTSVGWGAQDTSRVPASEESAPYFSELVANS